MKGGPRPVVFVAAILLTIGSISQAGADSSPPAAESARDSGHADAKRLPFLTAFTVPDATPLMPPVPRKKPAFAPAKQDTAAAKEEMGPLIPAGFYTRRAALFDKKPMTSATAAAYRKIFALQEDNKVKDADAILSHLPDQRLRGYVLLERYLHPTAYRPKFEELRDWLRAYAAYPGADRILRLAQARAPKGFKGRLPQPSAGDHIGGLMKALTEDGAPYTPSHPRTDAQDNAIAQLQEVLHQEIARGAPSSALKHLEHDSAARILLPAEYDQLAGAIAKGYLDLGFVDKARALALVAVKRSGSDAPEAAWVGGLAAWKQNDYAQASSLFRQVAYSRHASSWMTAAGAYWASRASMRAGKPQDVRPLLEKAASWPRTFYGLIATRALGWDFAFNWKTPSYTAADADMLSKIPEFRRASALVAVSQFHEAEAELMNIDPSGDPALRQALFAYANHNNLPALAMRLAEAYADPKGSIYDAALYPMSPWKPEGGYTVDTALIHALIRQESRFDPDAQSPSGAMGLMQLMPTTADGESAEDQATYQDRAGLHALKDPQTNIDIGQRYVEHLLYTEPVGAELVSLLVAYNAGPGNLRHWKHEYADALTDPLLFIESIPAGETRGYVERVMANYWIYNIRLGQATPSLDAIAEGHWAPYVKPSTVAAADTALRLADAIH